MSDQSDMFPQPVHVPASPAEPDGEEVPFKGWPHDEDIIVQNQNSIAIYRNRQGGIVIRREREWDEDDDVFVILASESAIDAVIAKLTELRKDIRAERGR